MKYATDEFEIMDNLDDICFPALSLEGDEGVATMWETYLRPPTHEFLDFCTAHNMFSNGSHNRFCYSDIVQLKVTPRSKAARYDSAKNLEKAAMKVYTCIKSKSRNVNVGDIVQVGIVPQDSGKVDLS